MENNGIQLTVAQLMEIANTGNCVIEPTTEVAVTKKTEGSQICADKSEGAFFNPATLKTGQCKTVRFQVQNNSASARYLGWGAGFYIPGEDPWYPGSEFVGNRGVDDANFLVDGGPNAMGVQGFLRRCPRGLVKSMTLLRIANTDPLANQNVIVEKWNCRTNKCEHDIYSPICPLCPDGNTNFNSYRWNFGLQAYDQRNDFGILIPAKVVDVAATVYTFELELAFVEGLYGYVAPTC